MANRNDAKVQPPTDPAYPKCPICGWWDRKLRIVGSAMTPEERVALHLWAKHDQPFPAWMDPPPKEGDDPPAK